ncbi:hypothetical protein GIB67_040915 [Kingdonia uniflora]|uniref:Uncharacterized protein n=1 Tax=Kingdonia uniflora TaxID=39325 RepID=A0A7J7PC48_9MAGN|nr:hypothetical protein GIB67_040915 [Kingdonia uniflora]
MIPWPKAPRPNHRLIIISGFPRSSKPMGSSCTQVNLHMRLACTFACDPPTLIHITTR